MTPKQAEADVWTRKARRIVDWIKTNPFRELLVMACAVAMPVYALIAGYMESRSAAMRAGLGADPQVEVRLVGATLRVRNRDPRPLSEATIWWGYHLVDAAACSSMGSIATSEPLSLEHSLAHESQLEATLDDRKLSGMCHNRSQFALGPTTQPMTAAAIVEWRAKYYRPADMKEYSQSKFAFLSDDCKSIEGIDVFVDLGADQLRWNNESRRDAWACYVKSRASTENIGGRLKEVEERMEGLLRRKPGR